MPTMISKVKSAMSTLVGGMMPHGHHHHHHHHHHHDHHGGGGGGDGLPPRFPYGRPDFLELSPELLQYSTEHASRPVLTLKRGGGLPWNTGYADDESQCGMLAGSQHCRICSRHSNLQSAAPAPSGSAVVINAGKSMLNEDQASCEKLFVRKPSGKQHNSTLLEDNGDGTGIPLYFWGVYDGHAGSGAAIMASKLLHRLIRDRLGEIFHLLNNHGGAPPPICLAKNGSPYQAEIKKGAAQESDEPDPVSDSGVRYHMEKVVSLENLVMGVIETAFKQMDDLIEKEKASYAISGGCCALAAIHLMGKLYVANAGDSRAIIIRNTEVVPMTNEFTPESERQRLQYLGFLRPELLGNEFTHIEFPRRIQHSELGKKMLYRDHTMSGWAYKTIVEDDLKFPLIYGEGKKARVMATIGVTRGLGDHDLKVYSSNIYIKPFLSCVPEVQVYDFDDTKHGPDDVLVMGTDGLWDVTTDKEVADAVSAYLACCDPSDPMRYTLAAQDLLMRSRGVLKERGWRLPNDRLGSGDDITVFVVPLAGHEAET
ncbi:protein phosphatase 1H isoform X2 [Phyllopteryx taeniolatus]|uniref:protein phosphatase 1H isoform X2 n=1 Tax=Phyllopteryx taeniolatus TaxID=161469 RepID=UPI002AD35DF0|nr:protein phosphatase 1H isoform X2 [Phyllopteryx taeniolatus]